MECIVECGRGRSGSGWVWSVGDVVVVEWGSS